MFQAISRALLIVLLLQTSYHETNANGESKFQNTLSSFFTKIRGGLKDMFGSVIEMINRRLPTKRVEATTAAADETTATDYTTAKPTVAPIWCKNGDGIVTHGTCYWIKRASGGRSITYAKGKELCRKNRGQPADIYSEGQYNDLISYIRSYVPKDHFLYYSVWIGMTYDVKTSTAYIRHGQKAPFVAWFPFPKAPYNQDKWTQLHLAVAKKKDWDVGMINSGPTSKKDAVLCEMIYLTR